ncbi:glycoside hydrolase family 25 protein [Aliihoeflea sp. PC F10.4]
MRAIAALLTFAMLLSGCNSTGLDLAAIAPASAVPTRMAANVEAPVKVTNPRFGDRKPHPWSGRTPWSYAVHGTDVSRYQSDIDWPTARDAGISFAFIKATEGGDMLDPRFMENWNATRRHGIPRSAYHFFYFCRTASEQAQWFIRNVPREAGTLPHVLDMEWNHLSPTCRARPDWRTVHSEMKIFLDMIERHYGQRPIIYTSVDFYEDNRLHTFKGYDWWLRSVADHPNERYDGENFLFWQYTGTGIVPGKVGDADINVFNGSVREWRNWVARNTSTS